MTNIRIRLCAPATALAVAGLLASGCSGGGGNEGAAEAGALPAAGEPPAGRLIEATAPDGHALREVREGTAPAVRLEATRDAESGWNLHLVTEAYRFVPERAGQQARGGEGHAHLYLDDERIARVYGPWFHVPADAVPDGPHELSVITAHDHTAWATEGRPVQDTAEVTGRPADAGGGPGGH